MAIAKQTSQKNFFGFTDPLNARLYKWLAIPFFVFILLRLPYIFVNNILCRPGPEILGIHAAPGECYYYLNFPRYNWGIFIHLASVLPAGLLAVLQFTPRIRNKYRRFHRLAGYVSTALVGSGILSALAIVDRSFGGDISTVTSAVATGAAAAYALYRGVQEARAKHFAAHRDWMLRGWMYLGVIFSMRLIMLPMAIAIQIPAIRQYTTMPCEVISNIYHDDLALTYKNYPLCDPVNSALNPTGRAVVRANVASPDDTELTASMHVVFGLAMWIALVLHSVGVELYLKWANKDVGLQKVKDAKVERKVAEENGVSSSESSLRAAQAFTSAVASQPAPASLSQLTTMTR